MNFLTGKQKLQLETHANAYSVKNIYGQALAINGLIDEKLATLLRQ